tara:strand:+ start:7072 stop:9468 length:2397 start_codon:yes stop_codon:yes gene_type:complete
MLVESKMEDYLFRTPEGAQKKSEEIGFNGEIHESTLADGTKLYSPAKTEDEFIKWYRKNDPDAEEELGATVEALQYGKPKKNDPRKTPAKPSERRKGSKKNKPGSAKKPNTSIKVSKETEARLRKMMTEHNKKVSSKGKGSKASMGRLKSVYRRGAGAFSRSHAPNMSRGGWGIARVKAFLYLLRNGRPSNPNYKQDNDLLPKSHPRASVEEDFEDWDEEAFSAAEYQGRKVTLNKPFRTPKEKKKFAVYVKNPAGKVIIVRFGDPNMEIKRDDPKRRKAFRDRHNCAEKKDKTTAGYWSCYQWRSGSKVESIEDFNKTDNMMETVMGGCGCGGKCGSVEAAEPTPNDDETHNEYMSRCQEMGYSEEECMAAHEGHKFIEEEQLEGYGGGGGGGGYSNSCRTGYKMQGGKCVKATFQLDIDISVDEVMVDATTGNQVIRISGIAFHQGVNKNGWEITRKGANLAVSQMVGADLTLNHPKSDNGRFRRNMDGGVDEAVVGVVSEASIVDDGFEWNVKFKANVHRKELFEALESGLWLREGYGVSIGGTGIPDEIIEADDGSAVMKFESDFQFDHLAIVHKPAYSGAKIESVERVNIAETKEGFNSHSHSVQNIAKDMTTMSEEEIIIASEEEVVVETPVAEETPSIDYAAEIEALKASLAERDAKLESIKADEEAKVEEVRLSLVEKATELGIAGIDSLPSETLESIIASFESKMPVASEEVVEELSPVESNMGMVASEKADLSSEPVVANYLNRKLIKTPESLYEKAWNAWANGWNNTLSASETQAPTFREARDKKLI